MGTWRSGIIDLRRQITRRLLKNHYIARMYYHHRLHRETLQYEKSPLLIYQMGKVGSKTIRESLGALKLDRPVFHKNVWGNLQKNAKDTLALRNSVSCSTSGGISIYASR